jgi:hypothetical protein
MKRILLILKPLLWSPLLFVLPSRHLDGEAADGLDRERGMKTADDEGRGEREVEIVN